MKYFIMSLDAAYTDVPRAINWYDKINPKWVNKEEAYRLPRRELLFISHQDRVVYTDVLMKPFFLISAVVRDVLLMYDPLVEMKEVILLDAERRESKLYYLPILEEFEAVEETHLSPFNKQEENSMLVDGKISDKSIFIVKGKLKKYIICNLELIESLLKRGVVGIGLQEIKIRSYQ